MGQAKARGSFEQRATMAAEREAAEMAQRERDREAARAAEAERIARMPEARRRQFLATQARTRQSAAMIAGLMAVAASQMGGR